MGKPRPKPVPERRRTALRSQVQAWFEALRAHIGEIEGAEALANRIQGWSKPEDIMRAYPVLVPLFLDIVWRSRKTEPFAEFLRTESGAVAEKPTDVLALSQKPFDDIVMAHLYGTARLICERLQKEWIEKEREKRRNPLSRVPLLGALFPPPKTDLLLADYPQKGVYEALKPFLNRRGQFALVESLATLPTRTVSALGAVVGALESPVTIRALGELNKSDFKIVIEMAEAYVHCVNGAPAEGASAPEIAAPLAQALSHMLGAGPDFLALALANRQLAKDAIAKLAPVMKDACWPVFRDAEALRRVAECPPAIVGTLQALSAEMHQRVSMSLSEIDDADVITFAIKTLRDATDGALFLSWIRDEAHLSAWKQFIAHLKKDAGGPRAVGALQQPVKAAIKAVCERSVRVFADMAAPVAEAA
ncbi:MAG: hypothetical protein AB7I36_04215 [Rhodospirillaceae bacterium]